MKTKTILCYLLIPAFALSCKKDVPGTDSVQGTLTVNVGLFLSVNEEENNLKSTLGAEDFRVTIYNSQGIEISVFQRASDIPPKYPWIRDNITLRHIRITIYPLHLRILTILENPEYLPLLRADSNPSL